MSSNTPPPKRLTKSVLSMFLRTGCDRELYLSLHKPTDLQVSHLPVPLKARPGIGVLKKAGRTFEADRNGLLIQAFGAASCYNGDANGDLEPIDLATGLQTVSTVPGIILQAKFEPSGFQSSALTNMGIDQSTQPIIPSIAGMIPDVIVVRDAQDGDEEILADGTRQIISVPSETRLALSIIDVKHTAEANPSYSAEVALYAFMLKNWLDANGLSDTYFVSARQYLWTRASQGESALASLLNDGEDHSASDYLSALMADCEDVNFKFYMPVVLRFFREDLPRVVSMGDADWTTLEWHVDSRCSACDWLGLTEWATASDRAIIQANPTHYCVPNAALLSHLSRIAGISRGARRTFHQHEIIQIQDVAATDGSEQAYRDHSILRREKSRIPRRAASLHGGGVDRDGTATFASLSPYPHLQASIIINFDASSGLLTGIGIDGRVTGYVAGVSPLRFTQRSFVVETKSLDSEWVVLEALLTQLSDYITQSAQYLVDHGVQARLTGQLAFWERRQYEELCTTMGRHLPKVLALTDKKVKSLAWMFPPDDLLEKETGAVSPCVVFIEPIIRRILFAPIPHTITLYETARHYYSGNYPPRTPDRYNREYLTNGIPRERIYEIWSGEPVIQRGTVTTPRSTVIADYSNALGMQSKALSSIVDRLRSDYKQNLRSHAPIIDTSIPRGPNGVAFDSKLWIWWDELEHATDLMEARDQLASDIDTLEGSFEAVRLTHRQAVLPNGDWVFDISQESAETKLHDRQGYLALGLCNTPGFPLEKVFRYIPNDGSYPGPSDTLFRKFCDAIRVQMVSLDRINLSAQIQLGRVNTI